MKRPGSSKKAAPVPPLPPAAERSVWAEPPRGTRAMKDAVRGAAAAAFARHTTAREHEKLVKQLTLPHEKASKAELIYRIKMLENTEARLTEMVQKQQEAARVREHERSILTHIMQVIREVYPVLVPYEGARVLGIGALFGAGSSRILILVDEEATEHVVFGADGGHDHPTLHTDADLCGVKLRALIKACYRTCYVEDDERQKRIDYLDTVRFEFIQTAESVSAIEDPEGARKASHTAADVSDALGAVEEYLAQQIVDSMAATSELPQFA